MEALTSLASAPSIDCRPMDLRLREALIWADIQLCLLSPAPPQAVEAGALPVAREVTGSISGEQS